MFDRPVETQSVNRSTIRVFGRWSGPLAGAFQFDNGNTQVSFVPSGMLMAGEWVTVSVSRGVASETGEAMTRGYSWNFWTRTSGGTLDLTEIERISIRAPQETQIQSYGAYAGDLDNDGWTDLTIPNEKTNDVRIFLNDRSGGYSRFTIHELPESSRPSTSEGADFNADGHIDIALGSTANDRVSVLMGNGLGGFAPETSYAVGLSVRGIGVLDIDTDGDDDIVTANRAGSNVSRLINDGAGRFSQTPHLDTGGLGETSCVVADATGDGIQDVFIGAIDSEELIVLAGDGNGGLAVTARVAAGGSPWMLAAGDLNGDGDVDVVAANSFAHNAAVLFGNGRGGLRQAVTYPVGRFPLAIDLGDLDGDGDLDMVTSNYSGNSWTVYENDGSGGFVNPRTFPAGTAGSCATLHDRDNDGDLDLSGIDEVDDLLILFDNTPRNDPVPIALFANHPNPFNPSTTIPFTLDAERRVTITIFDAAGRRVRTLVDEVLGAGPQDAQWDATDDDGAPVSSGVYFYRMSAGETELSGRMVFIK